MAIYGLTLTTVTDTLASSATRSQKIFKHRLITSINLNNVKNLVLKIIFRDGWYTVADPEMEAFRHVPPIAVPVPPSPLRSRGALPPYATSRLHDVLRSRLHGSFLLQSLMGSSTPTYSLHLLRNVQSSYQRSPARVMLKYCCFRQRSSVDLVSSKPR